MQTDERVVLPQLLHIPSLQSAETPSNIIKYSPKVIDAALHLQTLEDSHPVRFVGISGETGQRCERLSLDRVLRIGIGHYVVGLDEPFLALQLCDRA